MKYSFGLVLIAALVALVVPSQAKNRICEPGSVFMDDCNRCRCSIDGYEKSCTRIMCLPKDFKYPNLQEFNRNRRSEEEVERCEPGSKFKIDCNDCICPETGLKAAAACTLKLCL